MNKTKIYYNKNVVLKRPIMVVGLPGIGNVGALVGEYLKNELKAKRFATLYSPFLPYQVVMQKDGGMRMVNNRFYYWKRNGKSKDAHDIIILLGDYQAQVTEGQYEINEKIVKFFKALGGSKIYTVGGYNISNTYVENPRVFGVVSNKKLIGELKQTGVIFGEARGMIWGAAGIIPAFAKMHGIDAACIMGETGIAEVDANAAKSVLEVLAKALDVKVDFTNLNKMRKEAEKTIKAFEEAMKKASEPPGTENFTYIR